MTVGVGVGLAAEAIGVAVGVTVGVGVGERFRDGVDHSISSSDSITLIDLADVPTADCVVVDDVIDVEVEVTVAVGLG